MDERLRDLICDSWKAYKKAEGEAYLVQPSIPILFFGDSEKYFSSKVKVITVGLNPSRCEFPEEDRFQRFAAARYVSPSTLEGAMYDAYVESLNEYYRQDPYNWFDCYEYLLRGLDCSYHGTALNTALHTDICTPLATDPTWSGLPPIAQGSLIGSGRDIWHTLVKWLSPDLIIASVAREHIREIRFRALGPSSVVHSIARRTPYTVEITKLELGDGKITNLVFGQAAQKPFGTVSNIDKPKIGKSIRAYLKTELQGI